MRLSRRRAWIAATVLLVLMAGGAAAWWVCGVRGEARALVAALPAGDGVTVYATVYANVALLRQAGLLGRLAGAPGAEESDYRQFVTETGFDYTHDLDEVAARFRADGAYYIVRGRFSPTRLAGYAAHHGGRCAGALCSLPASDGVRQVSFLPVPSNWWRKPWLALAVSPDPLAAGALGRVRASHRDAAVPAAPVWMVLPAGALHAAPGRPLILNGLLDALSGAKEAVLSVEPAPSGAIVVALRAPCADPAGASLIVQRLDAASRQLKEMTAGGDAALAAEEALSALAAGQFQAAGSEARGEWRLPRALLDRLAR